MSDALDDETSARLSARLRQARLTRKMTLKVLARAARCSESLLSKIENGKAYPSLPMLDRLVKALDIGMGWMFDDHDGDEPIIFRAERHAAALARRVVTVEQVILESDRHALRCSFFHIEAGVTSNGEDRHIGEEVGYLVDGRLELLIAGGAYRLDVGDAFAFHSHQPHTYRNIGISRATLLWVSTIKIT